MLIVEELANGIVQITNQGVWDDEVWQQTHQHIVRHLRVHTEPPYFLINLTATTELDLVAFGRLVITPEFAESAMAILVARRAHLKLTRDILTTYPKRDSVQLRLMSNLEDAIQTILDRQALNRINNAATGC